MMKIRFGFVIGFAVGYYCGAKAGQDRYHQLNQLIRKAFKSTPAEMAAHGTKAVIDLSMEKAKDTVTHRVMRHSHTNKNGQGQPSGFSAS